MGQSMTAMDSLPQVEPDTSVADLVDVFEDDDPPTAVLLASGGDIVGAVTQIEIDRYMKTRQDLGM